jgi:hypothetical protein
MHLAGCTSSLLMAICCTSMIQVIAALDSLTAIAWCYAWQLTLLLARTGLAV